MVRTGQATALLYPLASSPDIRSCFATPGWPLPGRTHASRALPSRDAPADEAGRLACGRQSHLHSCDGRERACVVTDVAQSCLRLSLRALSFHPVGVSSCRALGRQKSFPGSAVSKRFYSLPGETMVPVVDVAPGDFSGRVAAECQPGGQIS